MAPGNTVTIAGNITRDMGGHAACLQDPSDRASELGEAANALVNYADRFGTDRWGDGDLRLLELCREILEFDLCDPHRG